MEEREVALEDFSERLCLAASALAALSDLELVERLRKRLFEDSVGCEPLDAFAGTARVATLPLRHFDSFLDELSADFRNVSFADNGCGLDSCDDGCLGCIAASSLATWLFSDAFPPSPRHLYTFASSCMHAN